jgi:hypothetical protein
MNKYYWVTEYEDWYDILCKLNSWELRLIENDRLWYLLECEKKILQINNIVTSKKTTFSDTISNKTP